MLAPVQWISFGDYYVARSRVFLVILKDDLILLVIDGDLHYCRLICVAIFDDAIQLVEILEQ